MLQSWISILSGLSLIISAMISTVQPNILFCIDMAVGLIVTVAGYRYACKSGSNETCTVPVQYSILTGVWLMISAPLSGTRRAWQDSRKKHSASMERTLSRR